ncbi:hypothetical protein PENDEC_c013G00655 [Penicillium decumbens]|uniref:Uncharacterized protein n=1 Tax=Penicillium decumbens TaxID=69771 RepID=A0A1V6PA27_PENDC|nr:hypothetical protein PENDEC_c013G00655 [Penicillium decumbens]
MIELRETLFKPFLATCTKLATFSTATLTPETTTSLNTQVIPRFPVDRTAYSVGRWSPHKRRRLPTDSIVGRDFTVEDPATTPAEANPEPKATVPGSEQSARMKMDLFGTYRLLGYATANHVSPTIAKIIDLYNSVQANTLALDVAAAGLSHDERKYLHGRLLAKGSYSRDGANLAEALLVAETQVQALEEGRIKDAFTEFIHMCSPQAAAAIPNDVLRKTRAMCAKPTTK